MTIKIISIELADDKSKAIKFDKVIINVLQKRGDKKITVSSFTAANADVTVSTKIVE
jgi:hypothetical protein